MIAALPIAVGFAQSPAASPSPTMSPSPGVSPPPSPTTTATATPPSGPIYKGRPCGVGRLIHDFLIVQEPPPGPVATCLEPMTGTGEEKLYRLKTVPADLQFKEILRDDAHGIVYVIYEPAQGPRRDGIQIVLSRNYTLPDPLILRDASIAAAANFLPVPGVVLDDGLPGGLRLALWHETSGSYRLDIHPAETSLTLEQAAALLEPFVPAPEPPPTGTGRAMDRPQDVGRAWIAAGVVLALSLALGSAALLLHRR